MQPKTKRPRSDVAGDSDSPAEEAESLALLRHLRPVRVLAARSHDKFLALLVTHTSKDGEGVLLLEKTPFPAEWPPELTEWIASADAVARNDIYHKLHVVPTEGTGFAQLKVTVIFPASATQISKLQGQPSHVLSESRAVFDAVVRPYIEKTCLNTKWVDNILNGTAEQERVIHNEPGDLGFVLLPDLKWDGCTLEDLYILAVVRRSDLTSLRDLHGEKDADLLRHVGEVGRQVISERYAIAASQLRVYLHYPPSFYHLHVHFTHADSQVPGQQPERAHLLDNVINNLQLAPDYYQRATLCVRVGEKDPLFELMSARESKTSNNCV